MKSGKERIVRILMDRDGVTREEAFEMYEDCRSELFDAMCGTSCVDPDDVLMEQLGLEPDYLDDFI